MGRKNKKSSIADALSAFNTTYGMTKGYMQDSDMREIADAKVEDTGTVESLQIKDADYYGGDGTAAGAATGVTAPIKSGVKFLGKEYDKAPTDAEQDKARMMAMSGVYAKHGDPMKAMEMKSKAQQSELQGIQLDGAKRTADRTKLLDEASNSASEWMKNRIKIGEDGQPIPLSDEDFVIGGKQRVMELAKRGLYDEAQQAGIQAMDYAGKKIQAETQERTAAVRDSVARAMQGDFTSALATYNKFIPDGSIATGAKKGKDGSITVERTSAIDGSKLPAGKFKDMDQFVSSMQALADPNAATQYLSRTFQHDIESRRIGMQGASLVIQQKAEGRAQSTFDAGAAGRGNTENAAKLQAVLAGTKDPAERAAITQQINDLTGTAGVDANAPAEVKLANAALKAGLHTDMKSALEWATKSKDLSPDKMRFEIYKTALTQSMGDAKKAKEVTDEAMAQFGPTKAAAKPSNAAKPATQADFDKLPKGAVYIDPDDGKTYRKQ